MPSLSNEHRLWVPMQVQALAFGKSGTASFIDLTPVYDSLSDPQEAPLGDKLRPQLEANPSPDYLPQGIHLHWTLPAAFTHVRPAADGRGSSLPLAPDRWLVMRLWDGKPGRLSLRCWVVESGFTHPDDAVSPWLEERDSGVEVTRRGRVVPLDEWSEQRPSSAATTAFAPGNLGFSSFYPSCRGVFGMHDPADDLPDASVCTYLVAGWFSDPASDPLAVDHARPQEQSLNPEARWEQRMLQHQWAVAEGTTIWPTAVTCFGIASGVGWSPDAPCDVGEQPAVRVALGSSLIEAVAALARSNGTSEDCDRLVNELQLAALAERRPSRRDMGDPGFFKSLGRLLGARARLHERGFSASGGGSSWEIVHREKERGGDGADAQATPQLTPEVSSLLSELNRLQQQCDEQERTLAGWRRRLFAAWYQHQFWSTRAIGRPAAAQVESLRADVQAGKVEVDARAARLKTGQVERDRAVQALRDRLHAEARNGQLELDLVNRAMPRFWRAGDPFLLTAGLQVPVLQGGSSPLQCRVSNQTIAGIEVMNVAMYGTIRITRDELGHWLKRQDALAPKLEGVLPGLLDLVLDAVFVDQHQASVLAHAYWQDRNRNPSDRQIGDVTRAIVDAQKAIAAAAAGVNSEAAVAAPGPLALIGILGSALRSLLSAVGLASAPSRPVFMLWKARWFAQSRSGGPADAEPWHFGDGIDYRWHDRPAAPDEQNGRTIESYSLIATGLERGLAATRKSIPEPEFAFVFDRLTRLAGQSLTGLTDALATRDTGPQLRPLIQSASGELRFDPIAEAVADQYAAAPLLGAGEAPAFAPTRGGRFDLDRLWIVDSFGRIRRVVDDEDGATAVAPPVLGRTLVGPVPGSAHLLPRLAQPARLLMRWVSAWKDDQQSLGDLGTSPICGFVVHNRLDRSLMIYGGRDENDTKVGNLLGAVQAIRMPQGKEAVRWTRMPVRQFDPAPAGAREPDATDIPNPRLRNFVNGLLAQSGAAGGTAFEAFRALLDRHQDAADLSLDQGLQSVLIGRPLALVRASLRLELDGPPLTDQGAGHVLAAGRALPEPWFRSLKFPVRIGDRRLGPDGLVGYFVEDDNAAAYQTLRLRADEPHDPGFEAHAYFGTSALEVPCDPDSHPIGLTLLLDPKRSVNIVSGILPASVITVPQPLVAKSLSDLELPFLVAPVLAARADEAEPETSRRMPLPTGGHDEWRWVYFPDARSPSVEAAVASDAAAAPSLFSTMALHEGWLKYRPAKGEQR